jgi:hypothetical protein
VSDIICDLLPQGCSQAVEQFPRATLTPPSQRRRLPLPPRALRRQLETRAAAHPLRARLPGIRRSGQGTRPSTWTTSHSHRGLSSPMKTRHCLYSERVIKMKLSENKESIRINESPRWNGSSTNIKSKANPTPTVKTPPLHRCPGGTSRPRKRRNRAHRQELPSLF